MLSIPLVLRDFQEIIENKSKLEEKSVHPIMYYDEEENIFFYKPIGYILYYVALLKQELPETINVENLIRQFAAIQVPKPLHITVYTITG